MGTLTVFAFISSVIISIPYQLGLIGRLPCSWKNILFSCSYCWLDCSCWPCVSGCTASNGFTIKWSWRINSVYDERIGRLTTVVSFMSGLFTDSAHTAATHLESQDVRLDSNKVYDAGYRARVKVLGAYALKVLNHYRTHRRIVRKVKAMGAKRKGQGYKDYYGLKISERAEIVKLISKAQSLLESNQINQNEYEHILVLVEQHDALIDQYDNDSF